MTNLWEIEVLDCIQKLQTAIELGTSVTDRVKPAARSPKRRQRQAAREIAARGIGTKSQQALAAEREALAAQRRDARRAQRREAADRQFQQRQRKEKHRGH